MRAITLSKPTPAERLAEALIILRGSSVMLPSPELIDREHYIELLRLQAKIEEADE